MIRNLAYGCKTTRVSNAVAAGTTSVNCTSVDMLGFEAVRFTALFGTLTSTQVTSIKAQGSDDNSTFTDLAGTAVGPLADADSNKALILDLFRPKYRYIRLVVVRGTANAVIDGVLADQYLASREPVTQDTSVSAAEVDDYAVAGTA